jgi:hypothetical protein
MQMQMQLWLGKWRVINPMTPKHGATGMETAFAPNEKSANKALKDAVSVRLYGTTIMQAFIKVGSVSQLRC